ncbi:hypothetical protein ABHN03_16795 [Paenibacillus sp. NRS-1775]|uniref:hypothetical protein n=1 Tax=unclassified Paenibacillus TaxID=185978 RepID=UPI003D28A97C
MIWFKKKSKPVYEKTRVMVLDPDLGFDVRWMDHRIDSLAEIIGNHPFGIPIKGTNLNAHSVPAVVSDDKRPNIEIEGKKLTGIVVIMAAEDEKIKGLSKIVSISADEVIFVLNTFNLK